MTRVVLITGASNGIGKEFAYKYASKGYNLLLVARREANLLNIKEKLETEYGIKVFIFVKDLSVSNAAKELYNFTNEQNIIVDILINNAGFGDFGDFSNSDLEKQTNMIKLNIISLVEITHYYLRDMIDRNYGKVLNVASIAGFMPGPKMSVYYATKAFVLSFTEALSEEMSKLNIQVSALCPGPTKTDFEKNADVKFSNVKMSSVQEVVNYAYNQFMNKNKVIILPGLTNKLFAITTKIAPRCIVRKSVNIIQSRFRGKNI